MILSTHKVQMIPEGPLYAKSLNGPLVRSDGVPIDTEWVGYYAVMWRMGDLNWHKSHTRVFSMWMICAVRACRGAVGHGSPGYPEHCLHCMFVVSV